VGSIFGETVNETTRPMRPLGDVVLDTIDIGELLLICLLQITFPA
jgi:hypothetical protein